MGDPTLRMNIVAPPTELTSSGTGDAVQLTWKPSPDAVLGYHVYRSLAGGPFLRLNETFVPETHFIDSPRPAPAATYMVRAVSLHVGPSGSYYNGSQGAFTNIPNVAELAANAEPGLNATTKPADVVWVEDAVPAGAVSFASSNDRWTWVSSNPRPLSGAVAHQSDAAPGLHHHFFAFAEAPLVVNEGDTLFACVFLDPANPPRQIMLTWLAGDWEHLAYWGENLIIEGVDESQARRRVGPLPATGEWIRLELPARSVDLENRTATGMGFTLFDGRATWDRAGRSRP